MLSAKFYRTENYYHTVKIFVLIILLEILAITASNLSIKYSNMELVNFGPFFSSYINKVIIFDKTKLNHG